MPSGGRPWARAQQVNLCLGLLLLKTIHSPPAAVKLILDSLKIVSKCLGAAIVVEKPFGMIIFVGLSSIVDVSVSSSVNISVGLSRIVDESLSDQLIL